MCLCLDLPYSLAAISHADAIVLGWYLFVESEGLLHLCCVLFWIHLLRTVTAHCMVGLFCTSCS
jgi:hypothetical protein